MTMALALHTAHDVGLDMAQASAPGTTQATGLHSDLSTAVRAAVALGITGTGQRIISMGRSVAAVDEGSIDCSRGFPG